MIPAPDRIEALRAQNAVTGIDFVHVELNQTTLDVFFLNDPLALSVPFEDPYPASRLRIFSPSGGDSTPEVPVLSAGFAVRDGRNVLRLQTPFPGDFSRYRLRIEDPRVDPFYNGVSFTFKANCPTGLDCAPAEHDCSVRETVDYPVDYLARDFWSLRQALLDFAGERYPAWQDRTEADAGMMWAELLAAEGDTLAYYQDRIAQEHRLESASQRRSIRRLARLVDYHLDDGRAAATWLDITVAGGQVVNLPAGFQAWETVAGHAAKPVEQRRAASTVVFEAGNGLADRGLVFVLSAARNQFEPHSWDEDDLCLAAGATSIHIRGHHAANLPFDDFTDPDQPAKWMLLRTRPLDPAIPERIAVVRVIGIENTADPVLGVDLTRLTWTAETATQFEMELESLVVRGNLVRATAGETLLAQFIIGAAADGDPAEAVERAGPDATVAYRFTLPGSDARGLSRLGEPVELRRPELRLYEAMPAGGGVFTEGAEWEWRRALIGVNSSQPSDRHFEIEDGSWRRIAGFRLPTSEVIHRDYAAVDGATILFGNGEFGRVPPEGTLFQAVYRLGNGLAGNIAPGVLTDFDRAAFAGITSVTNPVPGTLGADPETPAQVRLMAPEAWRAVTHRAVRAEDYAEAVERLPWVQRAGAEFRWTGSWHTVFATPDPRGTFTLDRNQRIDLHRQLDRFRQAGREAYGRDPLFAAIDLKIHICVAPDSYRGQVKQRVLHVLFGARGFRPEPGFFSPDNFTFSTPLDRSQLEAAIQRVAGVRAVEAIWIRQRGRFPWRLFSEPAFVPRPNEVIRVENAPEFPERGAVTLVMEGGA